MIDVRTNFKQIERRMSSLAYNQLPFAMAQTLNQLGRIAIKDEKANEQRVLDRPKPFTQNAIRLIGAGKGRLYAIVRMLPTTAKYLEPYQFGGKNALNSKALLKPVEAKAQLDQFGNLPRNLLKQLKWRSDIFIGTVQTKVGPISGVWQRPQDEGSHALVARRGKLVKTKKSINTGGKLKLLIKFEDAHDVKQHLDWFGVADRSVSKNFNKVLGKALARAVASARR